MVQNCQKRTTAHSRTTVSCFKQSQHASRCFHQGHAMIKQDVVEHSFTQNLTMLAVWELCHFKIQLVFPCAAMVQRIVRDGAIARMRPGGFSFKEPTVLKLQPF